MMFQISALGLMVDATATSLFYSVSQQKKICTSILANTNPCTIVAHEVKNPWPRKGDKQKNSFYTIVVNTHRMNKMLPTPGPAVWSYRTV